MLSPMWVRSLGVALAFMSYFPALLSEALAVFGVLWPSVLAPPLQKLQNWPMHNSLYLNYRGKIL